MAVAFHEGEWSGGAITIRDCEVQRVLGAQHSAGHNVDPVGYTYLLLKLPAPVSLPEDAPARETRELIIRALAHGEDLYTPPEEGVKILIQILLPRGKILGPELQKRNVYWLGRGEVWRESSSVS